MRQPTPLTEQDVFTALRDIYDPQMQVSIVDMGLVYRVAVAPDPDAPGMLHRQKVEIDLTMTSWNFPGQDIIVERVKNRLAGFEQVSQTKVNLVWEPPWSSERMSFEARKRMGMK